MRTLPRIGAVGASIALAAATLFAGPAGADAIDIESPLEAGSGLTIHAGSGEDLGLPAPSGSKFVGNFDDETGELNGEVTITAGSFETQVEAPVVGETGVTVSFAFESAGPITDGEIDADGNVSFTDVQTLRLTRIDVALLPDPFDLPDSCAFDDVELNYTGTLDADSNTIDVTAEFDVDGLESGVCGDILGLVDVADSVTGAIGNDGRVFGTAALIFELGVNDIPDEETPDEETPDEETPDEETPDETPDEEAPTTTAAPTTTTPAGGGAAPASGGTAAPAAPVSSSPTYTG